ncbi:MAG: VWA domain-containing protein [Deltaproteobacteria bacterium]|nr:VWA domain-containing protein [Deltaproteobacteria bacterium]
MSLASIPWLLAAVAAASSLLFFWHAADRKRRAALEVFAAPLLLPDLTATVSAARRSLKRALLVAAVLLGGLALAGPQYGFTWQETQRRGIDVLIALDTSRSMLAQDVAPNRLERAKLAVRDLVDKLGSDRVGLIAFAGSAFLQCPLTLDHAAFLESLDALQPGVIPAPGSDLASALRTAEEALSTEQRNVKLLVLFSDGEDLGGGALAAAKHAAELGIRVFTVGVGSDAGELIPLPTANGGTEFLKGPDGQYVKSKLDAETLGEVAELTGGFYEPLGRRGEGVAAIYDRALAPLPKEELASRMRRVSLDRFQWPLGIALLCLVLEPLVRERASRDRGRGADAAGVVVLALLLAAASAEAASVREAQRLYAAGQYDEALAEYRAAVGDAPTPQLDFNVGAAAYKAGQYADAAGAFARALGSGDPKLQEQGFYNLGNAQFRLGQQTRDAKPEQTAQAWQQAIDAYENALKVDPQDEDARHNRDFVKRALEELQEQQKQEDQQKNEEQQKDQDQQENQDEQQQQDGQSEEQQRDRRDEPEQQGERPDAAPQATPSPQPAKNDAGDQQPESGKEQPAQGDQAEQPPGDAEEPSAARQEPGQMSPDEARDLLDSLKDGEASLQELDQNAPQRRARPLAQERDW